MIKNKGIFLVIILLLVFVAITLLVLTGKEKYEEKITKECPIETEEKIVRGNSLTGLVEHGETITVLFGYYDCNEVERKDIILYSYAGNEEPLIKIVKGIPGDEFNLQKTEDNGLENWHIIINNQVLKNSENKPYLLSQRRYEMLSLYQDSYQGKIPEKSFLIMSNLIGGGMDSTRFGLIHEDDILGKAIR